MTRPSVVRTAENPDPALVRAATALAARLGTDDNHSVAAARDADGRVVTGVNVYHFTGGPCAELVVLGAAVAEGAGPLVRIVAAGDRGRGVLPPCGRCRQALLDLWPDIEVLVPGTGGGVRAVPVRELLPHTYVWADHQEPDPS